jgi:hypothetical protein
MPMNQRSSFNILLKPQCTIRDWHARQDTVLATSDRTRRVEAKIALTLYILPLLEMLLYDLAPTTHAWACTGG